MAAYYEIDGSKNSFFKSRAYKKASEIISKFPHNLASSEWSDIEKLKTLDGIGQSSANNIIEFIKNGKISEYEDMKKSNPINLEELLNVQGIGPKTVLKLYKELNVTDLNSLKLVAESGAISKLEGFGDKKQESILENINFAIVNKGRISISVAEDEINELIEYMKLDKQIINIVPVGSFRRKKETIGDIDLLVSSVNSEKTMQHFISYHKTEKILGNGETKSSIWLNSKIQADIRIIEDNKFGSALQYFTGNVEHNVKLRNIAISKGLKLSEYGLFKRESDEIVESRDEKKIYEILVGNYIEPELRENEGEIEAAMSNSLPNIIDIAAVNGDLHMHTTFSDGVNSIEEMAQKGIELGYKYIGITDHFGKLKIANAIDESEFDEYLNAIRMADEKIKGIKIYAGTEVEIDADGNLEYDENKLAQLDYIVAAVHFLTKMDRRPMTNRIIKALKNPLTKILAHPTGRIIGQRPGFEFDSEEVFKVAKEEGVAIEINAHPARLDLNDTMTKLAIDIGCGIIINTDSHAIVEMENMRFGIDVARRGWVQSKNLLKIF